MDSEDGIDNIGGELLGKGAVQLRGEGGTGNREQELTVDGTLELEVIEELSVVWLDTGRSMGDRIVGTFKASVFAIS